MNADLLAGMVLCLLAVSGAAFGYYLTVSVVMLLLLFNNMFFACLNSRTVKPWFTKKGAFKVAVLSPQSHVLLLKEGIPFALTTPLLPF